MSVHCSGRGFFPRSEKCSAQTSRLNRMNFRIRFVNWHLVSPPKLDRRLALKRWIKSMSQRLMLFQYLKSPCLIIILFGGISVVVFESIFLEQTSPDHSKNRFRKKMLGTGEGILWISTLPYDRHIKWSRLQTGWGGAKKCYEQHFVSKIYIGYQYVRYVFLRWDG